MTLIGFTQTRKGAGKNPKKTIHPAPEQKGHALTFITCTTELDKEFNYG
jgi:hypothetical protein